LGVGRFILPLAYQVTDEFAIGGSLDFVWANLDIKMAAGDSNFNAMATSMSGVMPNAMGALAGMGANTYRLDFSDNNKFTGEAMGSGWAGKLGFTYKLNPQMTIGGSYHSKTHLGDLKTADDGATFSAYNVGGSGMLGAIRGKVTVHNFQWPETYGIGFAYQANDRWMIAADYKRINWADVMKDFNMTYSAADVMGMGAGSAGLKISQNWENQNVFMIGAAYKVTDALTVRFGGNFAKNPIPDDRVHPLFPAIVEKHYTAGVGYQFDKTSGVDFALMYAPEVSVTGTQMTSGAAGSGIGANGMINIKHSQLNWQAQYRHAF
jgi:long-chain fatty acid transport protein